MAQKMLLPHKISTHCKMQMKKSEDYYAAKFLSIICAFTSFLKYSVLKMGFLQQVDQGANVHQLCI